METPLRLTFHGGDASDALSVLIRQHVDDLERMYGRMTSCNVVVQIPDRHHRVAAYAVNIHIAMPGGIDVNIDSTPQDDDRFAVPQFAVTDAFRRAKRALSERAQKLRGEVKTLRERVERTIDQPPEG